MIEKKHYIQPQVKDQKIFYGYVIVLGAWLAMFVSAGAQFSFGVFQPYLLQEFGWSRGMLSLGFTLNLIVLPLFSLFGGYLVDRIGPKWTVISGAVIGAVGMVCLSQVTKIWHFIVLYGVIFPIGIGLSYQIATVSTVRRWFMRKGALMVSIAMTGSGLGIVILTPVAQSIMAASNWQTGYILFGIVLAIGGGIGGLLLKKDPESAGTYPDGIAPTDEELNQRPDFMARGETWLSKDALRTRTFWLLVVIQSVFLIGVFGFLGHLITWANLDLNIAIGTAVSIFSFGLLLSSVVGRLFSGAISDWYMKRFGWTRKPILYVNLVGMAFGCFLATRVTGQASLIAVAITIGFTYGLGQSIYPVYLGDLFGVMNLPFLFGFMGVFTCLTGSTGPIIYGFSYDITGKYTTAFVINGLLCLISVYLLYLVKIPQKKGIQ